MSWIRVLAGAVAASLVAGASLAQPPAARPTAWFGVPTPGPVSDLDRPLYITNDKAYGPTPVLFKKRRDPSGALAGPKLTRDMRAVVEFSRQSRAAGEPLWGRIAGMPAQRRTVEWTVARLKAAGFKDAKVETYPVERLYWPTAWSVKVLGDPAFGAGSQDVTLQSAFPVSNARTLNGVLTAPLVFVGRGSPAELANVDVRGKVAVVNVVPNLALVYSRERGVARTVFERGAVAVINAVESPGNFQYFDSRYGCGEGPCFLVGGDDGAFLESVIGRAAAAGRSSSLRAAITLTSEVKTNLVAANGYAVIPGRSDEVVIVNSHTDAWFDGANDNADGMAVFLALAEYFARGRKPDRTLVFVASGGHHGGNGPAAFIAAHPEIIDRTVMVINLEHLAQIQITQTARTDPYTGGYATGLWGAGTTEMTKRAGTANAHPYVAELMGRASQRYGVSTTIAPLDQVPGDLGAYVRTGKPAMQLISSQVFYHSSGDNPSTISEPGMERAAHFYVDFIEAVMKTPRERLFAPGASARGGGGGVDG